MKDSEHSNFAENRDAKLTELENLEVKRRVRVAIGVLPRAIELFRRRKHCEADVKAAELKENREMWILLSAIVLAVGHLILSKDNFWASLPGGMAIMLFCWLGVLRYERYAAYRDKAKVDDSLMALSVTFYGAADWGGFWGIDEFCDVSAAGPAGFDAEEVRVREWLFRLNLSITKDICGVDDFDRTHAICLALCRRCGFDENVYWYS